MRHAIVRDSTRAVVPDEYQHLFIDLDEERAPKKNALKSKRTLKRIKTITVKKKTKMSSMGTIEELTEKKEDTQKSSQASGLSKLSRMKSHGAVLQNQRNHDDEDERQ